MTLYESYDAVTAALKVAESKLAKIQRQGLVVMEILSEMDGEFITLLWLSPGSDGQIRIGTYGDERYGCDGWSLFNQAKTIDQSSGLNKVCALERINEFREHIINTNVKATKHNRDLAAQVMLDMQRW